MEKTFEFVGDHIATVAALLITLVGILLMAMAALGSFEYQALRLNLDLPGRLAAGAAGLLVFGVGFWQLQRQRAKFLAARKYGVKITSPVKNGNVPNEFEVHGEFKKSFKQTGYKLFLFRLYAGDEKYYPIAVDQTKDDEKSWKIFKVTMGSDPKTRRLAVYLIGPSGQALIKYLKAAEGIHNKVRADYRDQTGNEAPYLPPLDVKTDDMHLCHEIEIVRG
jgi:hypothetical protein